MTDTLDTMRVNFWKSEHDAMRATLEKTEKALLEAMGYKERISQLERQLRYEANLSRVRREEIDRLSMMVMELKK